ncbi:hypothetical protein [Halomonas caseinilytica]|uniref:Lipoprotein n=1 Tax=Halomonas caseinilytica TaxID=438744 RepID=A0A1M6NQX1_9GAMM|nr:hypothetical protein [Halomonas caseinilytica]SHJ98127.1 hypothetical protein SAMN05192556_101484 [Halomonas caseinilytica]
MHRPGRQDVMLAFLLLPLCGSLAACAPEATMPEPQPAPAAATTPRGGVSAGDPASISERYFHRLETGAFDQAYDIWATDTPTHEGGRDLFATSMLAYQSFDGEVTGAARTEGAAGTLYAKVPIRVSGTRRGEPFSHAGTMTLKRCNDVPGCSEQARHWRIHAIDLDRE